MIIVASNLISRGLPTFASIFIEDKISKTFNISEKKIEYPGKIDFKISNYSEKYKFLETSIYKSFFIVDPRINNYTNTSNDFDTWEEHAGSEFEYSFYSHSLSNFFGRFLPQCVETQRSIDSIIEHREIDFEYYPKIKRTKDNNFYHQNVDFSIQAPKSDGYKSGIVIEIDGSQHDREPQSLLDNKRDDIVEKIGWKNTIRIKTKDINSIDQNKINYLKNYLEHPYFKTIKHNYKNPVWNNEDGIDGMQIALTPFGIARIQKSIIELIINGLLDLNAKVWSIAFIERDVPCANLAIQDLEQLLMNLFSLEGKNRKLPIIKYRIFTTKEFKKCKLNLEQQIDSYPDPLKAFKADILLDISILQKAGLTKIEKIFFDKIHTELIVTIRSSHSIKEPRIIKSAMPLYYEINEKKPETLEYFLQNIFRKEKFRPGQIDILKRSLKQENVIALLPTGAGKSLTYQLSAILQPGIVLIIDPLKSLMKDQNDNLKSIYIDSTVFINSSIKSPVERQDKTEKMIKGYYQFIFISPERLQIHEFRDQLNSMTETYFSYCVIDEAHCVSEWGHDFRTSYLKLGQNVRQYCKTLANDIPILGLTGTASFDVLADVQRELDIKDDLAIIAPEKYEREELNFEIIDVGIPDIPCTTS